MTVVHSCESEVSFWTISQGRNSNAKGSKRDLKVDVSALGLLLLPGHVDEGPLDVVVDDLSAAARPFADLLLVGGVALYAQPDLLQAPLLQHLLGHVAVLDVLEEAVHRRAEHGCKKKTKSSLN